MRWWWRRGSLRCFYYTASWAARWARRLSQYCCSPLCTSRAHSSGFRCSVIHEKTYVNRLDINGGQVCPVR